MNRRIQRVAGILLAAGASTRMGKTKQLLPVNGGTLLERVLNKTLKSELDKTVLVLGHEAMAIRAALDPAACRPGLIIIENTRYKQGISSSLITGLTEVKDSHDHVMILLADMPLINTGLINRLIRQYLTSGLPIGAVKGRERACHPVIFSRQLYPELEILRGDIGARGLLRKYGGHICLVEPDDRYDERDIDDPGDYASFVKSLSN